MPMPETAVPRMVGERYRLAYLVTHPIQYQAPLLRLLAAQPDIDLTVFFQSDMSVRAYVDPGFGRAVRWDVPLTEGYRSELLPGLWRHRPVTAQRPLSWGLARRLRRSRFDALWVHGYARWVNWAAIAWAKARGLKVLVRDEATAFSAERSAPRRLAKRAFFRALASAVDGFLAIGSANRDYYLAQGIRPERIFDVPYCVDNAFFAERAREAAANREALRAALGLEAGRPIILFASKFEARKRPDDLLHAYERLAEGAAAPYLLLAGDGEMRPGLEAEARAKGLAGVRFLGFRNQSELPSLYDLCDVFVLPSTREPWGLVVNEVMATGKPVVVSDAVGCARDLVRDGVNGLVVPFGDVEALAHALSAVLADPARASAMGRASEEIMRRWSFAEDVAGLRLALRRTLGELGRR
jgi:glycosyltransferase involved in cell wall biosynthesis